MPDEALNEGNHAQDRVRFQCDSNVAASLGSPDPFDIDSCSSEKNRALMHEELTEIYQIIKGSGTLVTRGGMEESCIIYPFEVTPGPHAGAWHSSQLTTSIIRHADARPRRLRSTLCLDFLHHLVSQRAIGLGHRAVGLRHHNGITTVRMFANREIQRQ